MIHLGKVIGGLNKKQLASGPILMTFLLRPTGEKGKGGVVTILPSPGFVIKSKLVSTSNRPNNLISLEPNLKIFINVCHGNNVPKPDINFDPNVVYPLIMENQWEIPIITSAIRMDKDKKGILCYVWDCCVNTNCMEWISSNLQLREILVEWCLESCEISDMVEISRDSVSFPKMKKKGEEIPPLEILSHVLESDFKRDIASFVEDEKEDPTQLLKLKRDLLSEDTSDVLGELEDNNLPPLFPVFESANKAKPLIQEIDDLSIAETKREVPRRPQKTEDIHYEVTIRKTKCTKDFKLRIDITSELTSASDLNVQYKESDNSLLIRNTNLDMYNEKKLQVPLPNIFTQEDIASMECLFVNAEKKLVIFI